MLKPFNSIYEVSLRTLILLSESGRALCEEEIFAADFIATYGHAFSITESNLNGNNRFMFSEARIRKQLINASLKELVLNGHAIPSIQNGVIHYEPSDIAVLEGRSLETDYAKEYRIAAKKAVDFVVKQGVSSIISEIEFEDKRG